MKTPVEKRLFWFLREGTQIDLADSAHVELLMQHVLASGRTDGVSKLLKMIAPSDFARSFRRIKDFLPQEVRMFWEEWRGDIERPANEDTQASHRLSR